MDFLKDFFYRGRGTPKGVPSHRIVRKYGLYGLSAFLALAAVMVWPFDQTLSDMVWISRVGHNTPLWWEALKGLRVFGKGDVQVLLGFLLAIHRRKQVAVCACIAMLLTGLIVTPMKHVVGRPRPDESNKRSFPSGDVASLTAFLVPIASTLPVFRSVAFVGVASVGTARVVNGFHFPSDVLAGAAVGIFAGAVVVSLKFPLRPRVRRFLRRSSLAAVLGVYILIGLFLPFMGNLKRFLSIFGPAAVLLAVVPFIRAWLRRRGQGERRLLLWVICFLGGAALVGSAWFVVALVPAIGMKLPGIVAADPAPIWAIVSTGCVLLVMTFLSLREYGSGRYRSTVGILTAGVVTLLFTVVLFVAFHGWKNEGGMQGLQRLFFL